MRVLIAFEFSGIVREAVAKRGHQVYSCDLLPTEQPCGPGACHEQGDLFTCGILDELHFDLLIAHPPCTFLTNAGVRWLYVNGNFGGGVPVRDGERWRAMEESARMFRRVLDLPIERIAVENPIPHKYALEIIGERYTQIVQPWQFGHGETKATCLWLKNLPPLKPTNIVSGRTPRVHHASPGPERWKERSRTLVGLANAMAEQWSHLSP